MDTKKQGFLSLAGAGFIYATMSILIRTLDSSFGAYSQVAIRSVVALIILTFIVAIKKYKVLIPKSKVIPVTLFAISFPLSVIFFTLSILETKAMNSVFSLYIGSLLIAFLVGTFIYKEKVTSNKLAGLLLVTIGLLFFALPFEKTTFLGIFLGLLAGVLDGASNSLRKYLKDLNRFVILTYQYLFASIFSTIIAVALSDRFDNASSIPVNVWLALFVFGVFIVSVGSLTIYGFKHIDLNIGTVILSSELVFATILALVFLEEIPALKEVIGGLFIVISILVSNLRLAKKK